MPRLTPQITLAILISSHFSVDNTVTLCMYPSARFACGEASIVSYGSGYDNVNPLSLGKCGVCHKYAASRLYECLATPIPKNKTMEMQDLHHTHFELLDVAMQIHFTNASSCDEDV